MIWTPGTDWRVRTALAFALAAAAFAVRATIVTLRAHTVAAALPMADVLSTQSVSTAAASGDLLRLAELAPFGASRADAVAPISNAAPAIPITLEGTIAGAEQPAAICRLGGTAARILHIGDTLGGWRLQQVAPGRAVFIDAASQRHELRLNSAGN